jgi:hypothetical protein
MGRVLLIGVGIVVAAVGSAAALYPSALSTLLGTGSSHESSGREGAPATQQAVFRIFLGYAFSDGNTCTATFSFTNKSTRTVDEFSADLLAKLDGDKREVSRFSVSYVDPGKSVDVSVKFYERCERGAEFELRGAVTCRGNGKSFRGCGKVVEVASSTWNLILRNELRD